MPKYFGLYDRLMNSFRTGFASDDYILGVTVR